jgi:hypothetical protein
MLTSITPLGERGRNQQYAITVTAFIVASTCAGALLGAMCGAAGSGFSSRDVALVVIAALGAIGLVLDRGMFGTRVPGPRRQVEEQWLTTYRGWVYGAGFGLQLGLGFTTIVSASATWLAFACALLSGSARGGLLIGATYGLVRALPVLLTARVREPGRLRSLMRVLDRHRPHMATATTAVQIGVVLAALAAVTTVGGFA